MATKQPAKAEEKKKPSLHTVKEGEDLISIAEKYGIKVDDLVRLNKENVFVSAFRTVRCGMVLKIR